MAELCWWRNTSTSLPKPIDFFLKNNIKIKDIKCGHYHNLAISENDKLWVGGKIDLVNVVIIR